MCWWTSGQVTQLICLSQDARAGGVVGSVGGRRFTGLIWSPPPPPIQFTLKKCIHVYPHPSLPVNTVYIKKCIHFYLYKGTNFMHACMRVCVHTVSACTRTCSRKSVYCGACLSLCACMRVCILWVRAHAHAHGSLCIVVRVCLYVRACVHECVHYYFHYYFYQHGINKGLLLLKKHHLFQLTIAKVKEKNNPFSDGYIFYFIFNYAFPHMKWMTNAKTKAKTACWCAVYSLDINPFQNNQL